ncbi:hypothetical protein CARUB_v10019688mg [Capsella rubella]|uniref:CMP/dCMP-type deaminase domain-containing protein n=2 Tax=Capsella rubella TaxID=81985 RepID=R0IAC4_9BRAS|nr:hypothetical protein CARUB_v10019688mg [Capsella rubella]
MFNTYTYSLQWPIRSRSYQDYCSLLPERSESYHFLQSSCASSISCCCAASSGSSRCCCCATPSSSSSSYSYVKPKVSINPGFVLYGIRQSTLIQRPSFQRRLLVGGNRLVGCEVYASCDGTRRKNRSFRLRCLEESDECCDGRSCPDDVEAMISFLSEELIDEERKWNLISRAEESRKVGNVRKVRVEGRDSYGNGRVTRKNQRERVERPEGFGRRNGIKEDVNLDERDDCEHCGRGKKSYQLESEPRRGSKLVSGESIKKSKRRSEEREVRPIRAKSSSCSSYYSLASSGEFESDTEDQEEDVEIHRENMRSSEKKIVEQSGKRNEASQMHSRRKKDESSNRVGSNYRKQVFEEGENSNQAVILNQRRAKKFSQTSNTASKSTENYEEDMEIHEIHVNDAETKSQTQKLFGEREDYRVHSICNDSGSENIESSQQILQERSEARYSSEEMRRRTKSSRTQEEGLNVLQKFPEATNNQQRLVEERISKQAGMRRTTERFSESSEIHDMDIRNTYISQSEDQIGNQEVHAGLVSGLQTERKQQDYHIEHNPLEKTQSDRTSVSVSHTSDEVRYTEIKRKSEKRLIGQGSTTIVQSDSNTRKSGAWKDSRLDHANSTKEDQMALVDLRSQEKLSEEASTSQSSLTLVSAEIQEFHQTTLIPPSSQLVSRGSGKNYGTGGVSIQEISHGTSESGYPIAFEQPREGALVTSISAVEPMGVTTHEDALSSAHQLEQASEKFVGEFLKKAKHEVSYPETVEQRVESNQLKRRDSRRSSGSGAKGPSDELWVTDSTQGTPQPGATEGNAAEGNAIFKRNGKSLWNVIADIARLRWGSRAGSSDSSAKPAGKSSPNESVSSATWFSGREHEGSSDDNKGDRVLPQEAHSLQQLEVGQTSPRSQFEPSGATNLKQRSGRHEGLVFSPSATILEGGSASNLVASSSGDQIVRADEEEGKNFEFRLSETASTGVPMKLPSRNLIRSPAIKEPSESSPTKVTSDQNVTVGEGRRYQARIPEVDAGHKQLPFPGRNLRSPVVKEPSESRLSMVSGSNSLREQVEQQQQPLSAKSQEETGSISTDSSFIQKKLQRNKQVVRDSFEEWEEAYRVESERRTVDEIFMREALVEAKKAADTWEVPVGAVLVHDGKIIARGFNL